MKLTSLAAVLVLLPGAPAFASLGTAPTDRAPSASPAAGAVDSAKNELYGDIEAWRATQLPHTDSPTPEIAELERRLNDIKADVRIALDEKDFVKPRAALAAWKKDLLAEKFAMARKQGLTHGATLAKYSSEQTQRAEFAATIHSLMAQDAVQRSVAATRARTQSALRNPSGLFDGEGRGGELSAGPEAVSAGPALDPKDPARYAKVRQILISQGASARVVDLAINEAIRQNADPLLVLAVINQESGFRTHATSSCGARGLMQLMPDTGRGLGVRNSGMLYDAQTNLHAGIRFLKSLCGQFAGGEMNPMNSHFVKSAVAAYNAGPGAVRKYSGVPPYRETQGYVRKVLGYYASLKQYLTA